MSEENKKTEEIKKSDAALREERVLEFWRENKIFEQSLKESAGKPEYVFYEGPPTANGKPGIHHLEARAFKDAIPRYKTMRGYHVRRKGGWDTHGLPVELQVEKALGLTSKKDIESYGVAAFNQKCKESVWDYRDLWEKFTHRIGYWVDTENPYVTYHNSYIESLWNIVGKVEDKGLLYKDYKVVPWCPRCGTGLSSHELAQGYQDVKDLSVTAKFKVVGEDNTYLLAWTTTPWTLPGNVGLAVGKDITYVKVLDKEKNEKLVLAKERHAVLIPDFEVIEEMKGSDLTSLSYEPLYPYLRDLIVGAEKDKLEKAYKVYAADFVTTTDGTGIVHTAVMYGQDDFVLGTEVGLPKFHLVKDDGHYIEGTDFLEGRFVRDEEVAIDIIKDLAHRGLLFKKEKYEHSYPHCWRCKTPLIYYARDSWYIKMSSLKDQLVENNKNINWEPEYIKEGRFGEWLRDIKDWAISRERYWGTPLPVWINDKGERMVVDSISTLKQYTKTSGNKYFFVRHGESRSNAEGFMNSDPSLDNHLTERGIKEVEDEVNDVMQIADKVDMIFASPLTRTKETAHILAKGIGYDVENIKEDSRLSELSMGELEGKSYAEFCEYRDANMQFDKPAPGGESYRDVVKRVGDFIYELERNYQNKNILIVAHGAVAEALYMIQNGYDDKEAWAHMADSFAKNADVREIKFVPLPHDENYILDLHRPYIDEIVLVKNGKEFNRTKEVMDVWFDSGAMPFAQDHYPFENKDWVEGSGFPADFICEAIDQTRGWFYTLHAVGTILGKGNAYKNVICLGHILDGEGKKMSKSLGNIVDPWTMIERYGVDTLRLWMYSVNQPGESKNFDEKTVIELNRKVFGLLYNVLAFYELYRDESMERVTLPQSKNILDKWIVEKLKALSNNITYHMDEYRLLEPVREIRDFMDDLSTWYLRRSRERIKDGDIEAKQTLYYVLDRLAILLAPFTPFTAEDIWQRFKKADERPNSVHLASWPINFGIDESLIKKMAEVRELVTKGLEARQKAGIKVRQPLLSITIPTEALSEEYEEIMKDELNVKEVKYGGEVVTLDTLITEELKKEGIYRELLRGVQQMRKDTGLMPEDIVSLFVETNEEGRNIIEQFEGDMRKTAGLGSISYEKTEGVEQNIEGIRFVTRIEK